MDKDVSEREALRRKAEEERAALKQDCEDDDAVHVTGRPKFAPPVKSQKQDAFGEKLKSSLGAFEEVAPLLQTLKNRPIYGVSTCPQTPAPTGGKAPFAIGVAESQPSTSTSSGDANSTRRNHSSQSSRREKTNGVVDANQRSRSSFPVGGVKEKERSRADDGSNNSSARRSTDRSRRNSKSDRHHSGSSSHHRRPVDDVQNPDQRSPAPVRKDNREESHANGHSRRHDYSSLNDRRNVDSGNSNERKQVDDSGSDVSTKRTSSYSRSGNEATSASTKQDDRHAEKQQQPKQLSNRDDHEEKEKRDRRNRNDYDKGQSNERNKDAKSNGDDSSQKCSPGTIKKRSPSRSPAEPKQSKDSSKKMMEAPATADRKLVQKKDNHGTTDTGKKHGQSTLRLESLSTLCLNNKDSGKDEIPSTPAIERMIKKVTGLVDAPPLSGIPSADTSHQPFSYPQKAENPGQTSTTKVSTKISDGSESQRGKSPAKEAVNNHTTFPDLPSAYENGHKKKTIIEDDLSLSESDGDDSDSSSESTKDYDHSAPAGDTWKLNQPRRRCVTTMGDSLTSAPNEKRAAERSHSESPKKDESHLQRSVMETTVPSPIKAAMKSEPEWSLSALLKSVTPNESVAVSSQPSASAESITAGPITSSCDSSQSAAHKNSRIVGKRDKAAEKRVGRPSRSRGSTASKKICKQEQTSGSDDESTSFIDTGMDKSYGISTSTDFSGDDRSKLDKQRPAEKTLKMTMKLKNGKVQVVDREKREQRPDAGATKVTRPESAAKRNSSPANESTGSGRKRKGSPVDFERCSFPYDVDDTGNSGKENQKLGSLSDDVMEATSKTGSGSFANGNLFYATDADTILKESRLSPLLSPIHEFPSLEFVNGRPTLLCQIPLNLLDRVPSKKTSQKDDDGSTVQERCRSDDENLCSGSAPLKSQGKSSSRDKSSGPTAPSASRDLDDVPILDRMNTNQKKRLSVSTVPEDAKTASVKNQQTPATKPRGAKNGNATTKSESVPKSGKTAAKRKASNDVPDLPISKAPKLELSVPINLSDGPSEPVTLELDCAKEQQYQTKAKEVKHSADSQTDKTMRILLYLESVVYFLMTGLCMEQMLIRRNKESSSPYTMVKTTVDLLTSVAEKYANQMSSIPNKAATSFVAEVNVLSLRIQSLCYYKMYEMRQSQAITNYRQLNDFHKGADRTSSSAPSSVTHSSGGGHAPSGNGVSQQSGFERCGSAIGDRGSGVTPSPTPSPASSTGSNHSLPPGLVAIPQKIEMLYKQQLSHLHSLMWAHSYWQQAETKMQESDKALFDHLDKICGPLASTSNLHSLCIYVLTAVTWLQRLYGKRIR